MIISLRLKNFFSIREDAILEFTAERLGRKGNEILSENLIDFGDDKFVNIIGLFGSNAAGKSNMLKALDFCRTLILNSHLNNEGYKFDFEPFKFEAARPSEFYINFVTEGVEYEYSFTIANNEIESEELNYFPNRRKARIFKRAGSEYLYGKSLIARPAEVEANTGSKTLFLSRASSMNRQIAQTVYRFFLNELIIGTPKIDFSSVNFTDFERYKTLLLKALEVSDSDIVDIRVIESTPGQVQLQTFHRENPAIPFDFDKEESDGTKRLLFILMMLLKNTLNKTSIFIDEFDLKLHLRLAEFILDVVRASRGAQLAFTSHNPSLINTKSLRSEQIVFVNKQDDGNSNFTPLSSYHRINRNANIQEMYLQGRFDAVPYVGSAYPIIVDLLEDK